MTPVITYMNVWRRCLSMGVDAKWGLDSKCCKSPSLISLMEPARIAPTGFETSRMKLRSIGRHCVSLAPLSCKKCTDQSSSRIARPADGQGTKAVSFPIMSPRRPSKAIPTRLCRTSTCTRIPSLLSSFGPSFLPSTPSSTPRLHPLPSNT